MSIVLTPSKYCAIYVSFLLRNVIRETFIPDFWFNHDTGGILYIFGKDENHISDNKIYMIEF